MHNCKFCCGNRREIANKIVERIAEKSQKNLGARNKNHSVYAFLSSQRFHDKIPRGEEALWDTSHHTMRICPQIHSIWRVCHKEKEQITLLRQNKGVWKILCECRRSSWALLYIYCFFSLLAETQSTITAKIITEWVCFETEVCTCNRHELEFKEESVSAMREILPKFPQVCLCNGN